MKTVPSEFKKVASLASRVYGRCKREIEALEAHKEYELGSYEWDAFMFNMKSVREDAERGAIGPVNTEDEIVAAVVNEYRLNLEYNPLTPALLRVIEETGLPCVITLGSDK
jgi:hypothetical protein